MLISGCLSSDVDSENAINKDQLVQTTYVKSEETVQQEWFGSSVSLDGNTLAVGIPQEENGNVRVGAVKVYTREGNNWTLADTLRAQNQGDSDRFGFSVSLDGNTLAVGAPLESASQKRVHHPKAVDNNEATNSGAVYVFQTENNGQTWSQRAYLKADNTHNHTQFGFSISLDGDTLAVGAYLDDSDIQGSSSTSNGDTSGKENSGAVFVFTRSGALWSQQAYLKAKDSVADDQFGFSVSLDGDTLAVGANKKSVNNNTIGAVYVFTRSGTSWSQQGSSLRGNNTETGDDFGSSVSLEGNTLAVGAIQANGTVGNSGAVYVFMLDNGTWTEKYQLTADHAGDNDTFGHSVSLAGKMLVVGAPYEDSDQKRISVDGSANNAVSASGAVYVFRNNDTSWTQESYLKAKNAGAKDEFGYSVTVDEGTVVVGSRYESSDETGITNDPTPFPIDNNNAPNSGAVYIYQ